MTTLNTEINKVKSLLTSQKTLNDLVAVMGEKAKSYLINASQIIMSNDRLMKCEPESIINALFVAASFDLPISPKLGFSYIMPYKHNDSYLAQYQLGYKGYIQLAIRSNMFISIGSSKFSKNQLIKYDPLKGSTIDFNITDSTNVNDNKTFGYVASFKLNNGFEKDLIMFISEIKSHAQKYSKSYDNKSSIWKDDFDGMALKTVLKLLLSKYAPLELSTLHKAVEIDQSVILDKEAKSLLYIDNDSKAYYEDEKNDKLLYTLSNIINDSKDLTELMSIKEKVPADNVELKQLFNKKYLELKK